MKNKVIISAILLIFISLSGCTNMSKNISFKNLSKISTPNYYLVCPLNYCNLEPNETSKTYNMDVQSLIYKWKLLITQQPRTHLIFQDKNQKKYVYIQKSKFFRFPDYIYVEFISQGNSSTLVILSRSKYGYSDFGVNKRRVSNWLKELDKLL